MKRFVMSVALLFAAIAIVAPSTKAVSVEGGNVYVVCVSGMT